VPTVLAITDSAEAAVRLDLDDFADTLILELWQVIALLLLLLDSMAFVEEFGGPEEGA